MQCDYDVMMENIKIKKLIANEPQAAANNDNNPDIGIYNMNDTVESMAPSCSRKRVREEDGIYKLSRCPIYVV